MNGIWTFFTSWAHFRRFDEGLCDSAVPPPVAGGDEVCHAAALQEGAGAHLAFGEDLGESNHLHQTQPDHCCFGVVAETEAVAEPGAYGHDVLVGEETIIRTFGGVGGVLQTESFVFPVSYLFFNFDSTLKQILKAGSAIS